MLYQAGTFGNKNVRLLNFSGGWPTGPVCSKADVHLAITSIATVAGAVPDATSFVDFSDRLRC